MKRNKNLRVYLFRLYIPSNDEIRANRSQNRLEKLRGVIRIPFRKVIAELKGVTRVISIMNFIIMQRPCDKTGPLKPIDTI